MKIVRFNADGATRVGALEGDHVVEFPGVPSTQEFIAGGAAAMEAARKAIASGAGRRPLAGVKLLAPVVPATILCSGSNYTDHNKEKANTPISGKEPEFFVKTADCVIGPGDTIVHDERLAKKLDSETELAIVIGKPGRFIPVERALEHVFGYTIVNDVTARDRQVRRNAQGFTWYELGRGKAFDCSAPLGPCIVTADEVGDPQNLAISLTVNGETRQNANTSQMIFDVYEVVSFVSHLMTLTPGDLIACGTPPGVAMATGKWLQSGDVITCRIEKIGELVNTVGLPPLEYYTPCKRN